MGTYCTDADLKVVRPNILDLSVEDWAIQRTEAYDYINKLVLARWYRPAAVEAGLDPDLNELDPTKLDAEQLKKSAVYKSLELAYMSLMKEGPDADGYERFASYFADEFAKEFDLELAIGLRYDWDNDGETDDEYYVVSSRRLTRS